MLWMLLLAATLAPDQWPQFRGPDGSGVAEDPRLPERWSQTENVAWKTDIPGLGWSSPVVWGDRIFVTSVIPLVEQEKPRTGLYLDGRLGPHLEISHQPFRNGQTYDQQLGNAARKEIGGARWNKRVRKAIVNLRRLTNFDHLYIGGGNAKKIDFELEPDITIVSNEAGITGGLFLWRQ